MRLQRPTFPPFSLLTGQGWPSSGQGWPLSGQGWPSSGQGWPRLVTLWPRLATLWPRLAKLWPGLATLWPRLAKAGQALAKAGQALARAGQALARAGHSLAKAGQALAKAGHSLAKAGQALAKARAARWAAARCGCSCACLVMCGGRAARPTGSSAAQGAGMRSALHVRLCARPARMFPCGEGRAYVFTLRAWAGAGGGVVSPRSDVGWSSARRGRARRGPCRHRVAAKEKESPSNGQRILPVHPED